MKINLIAIGKRLSDWVNYVDRLPRNFALNLIEIPALRWTKNADLAKIILKESQILLEAISKEGEIIVLNRTGEEINTLILSQKMADWRDKGRAINLLVGGPEGLVPLCFEKANWVCSLTQLTLPHPLVRIVIAEQIYRAWNIWPIILIIVNDKIPTYEKSTIGP
ncbi:23S rRNA (pseudouridine(1915)-N(3))-methyltransferase RlmH [Candidatus Coxiella mudrowiae]|uniref:Ribosomal RNA large subunit methyltransferase H n=1 Tax=Candidatus Coxiella mudrowiae TaxID=2054173 RepID=A0ABM5UUG0_9COXI|nr:23S rRNA (pseudouridine(1915)-N(3))-methyltransferase RlmH [Candidatus Coxiella mudrowiae]AKQ33583.1 Ribosomal RNA large subunit methyltransferase H [Candidatus Coxiella mudrowiae]